MGLIFWGWTSPCDCNSQRASEVHGCTPMHERRTSLPLKGSSSDILGLGVGGWLGGDLAMLFCVEKAVSGCTVNSLVP